MHMGKVEPRPRNQVCIKKLLIPILFTVYFLGLTY